MVWDTRGSMGMTIFYQFILLLNVVCRMKEHATTIVSDDAFAKRAERWPKETPDTKEAYFIRDIFDSKHPSIFKLTLMDRTRSVSFRDCCKDRCSVRPSSYLTRLHIHESTLAGYPEATGVVHQIPVAEASPFITQHTALIKNPESRSDTSAILYAKYVNEKNEGYRCSYATSCV